MTIFANKEQTTILENRIPTFVWVSESCFLKYTFSMNKH